MALQWWLNRMNGSLEHTRIASTLLLGFSRAAAQAEHLPAHKRACKIGRLILTKNDKCLYTRRLVQDCEGQYLYNRNPENRALLTRAFSLHDEESDIAGQIIRLRETPPYTAECLHAVGETYYNRLNILVKLGISTQRFKQLSAELEEAYCRIRETLDGNRREVSSLVEEAAFFRRMIGIRQGLAAQETFKACQAAEELLEDVRQARHRYPFLWGYANYWAGVARIRASGWAQKRMGAVEGYAMTARQAFMQVGNERMIRNVARELLAPKLG